MELTEQQKRELSQHYEWLGLTLKQMWPLLTKNEKDLAVKFTNAIIERTHCTDWHGITGEWPKTQDERWEALK